MDATDDARLREQERLFVWLRWMMVGFGVAATFAETGRSPLLGVLAPVTAVAVNAIAIVGIRTLTSVPRLQTLGVVVTVGDAAVATGAMFNYADYPDTATGLLLMLIVLEAAVRWGVPGGLTGGLVAGAIALVWMLDRRSLLDTPFRWSTAIGRVGAYTLAGLLLGNIMRQLDRAGREVRRRFLRTEAVGRFAVDAPRLTVDDAADRLAGMLHDELDFERAAVVVVDEADPDRFRLVATAGYERVDLEPWRTFPTSAGLVGRTLRTGESQFVPDVAADPDVLRVDPESRSEMTVPLRSRGLVFGVILVAGTQIGAFTPEDLRFLEAVGSQVGRAFDNARLAEMERRTIGELEQLASMQDDFIAIANHELRTPVTAIAGFAQSLLTRRHQMRPDEVDDAIERIARRSAQLKDLIEDLLQGRGSATRGPATPAGPVPIEAAMRDVVREFESDGGVHRVEVDCPPDLPDVLADRAALHRVLVNLVDNALKYSPDSGSVTVGARAQADGTVQIEVRDEGIGIREAEIPLLFTKFGRLPSARRVRSGMGLGLFIVHQLVEDMGGTVGVESEPGRGSTFWFRIPAAPGGGGPPGVEGPTDG